MRDHFLKPGDCATATEPTCLKTILGSCVAVALFDPEANVAGLNHFLLPEAPPTLPPDQLGRYGDTAIPWLLKQLLRYGASEARIYARVFGGGAVVQALTGEFRVGELNIAIARRLLAERRIAILSEVVGGYEGIHLSFNTQDFSAKVREIKRSA